MTRFLVDAHLPFRLVRLLREHGHDVVHTSELPKGNATPDEEINALPLQEEPVVVTKDADFVQSLILQGKPYKLFLISTGNISSQALEALFLEQLELLCEFLDTYRYVELGREEIVAHPRGSTLAPSGSAAWCT